MIWDAFCLKEIFFEIKSPPGGIALLLYAFYRAYFSKSAICIIFLRFPIDFFVVSY